MIDVSLHTWQYEILFQEFPMPGQEEKHVDPLDQLRKEITQWAQECENAHVLIDEHAINEMLLEMEKRYRDSLNERKLNWVIGIHRRTLEIRFRLVQVAREPEPQVDMNLSLPDEMNDDAGRKFCKWLQEKRKKWEDMRMQDARQLCARFIAGLDKKMRPPYLPGGDKWESLLTVAEYFFDALQMRADDAVPDALGAMFSDSNHQAILRYAYVKALRKKSSVKIRPEEAHAMTEVKWTEDGGSRFIDDMCALSPDPTVLTIEKREEWRSKLPGGGQGYRVVHYQFTFPALAPADAS